MKNSQRGWEFFIAKYPAKRASDAFCWIENPVVYDLLNSN